MAAPTTHEPSLFRGGAATATGAGAIAGGATDLADGIAARGMRRSEWNSSSWLRVNTSPGRSLSRVGALESVRSSPGATNTRRSPLESL